MNNVASLTELVAPMEAIMRYAGGIAKERESLDVEIKSGRNDLVTRVDRLVEDTIAQRLADITSYPLLGEEGHRAGSWDGRVWVLDPIDGTMNYVETRKDYAISLALCEDGIPVVAAVYDVERDLFYHAVRGEGAYCNGERLDFVSTDKGIADSIILTDVKEMLAMPRLMKCIQASRGHRRYGSAALECVDVAAGRAGAFVHMWVSPWDIAAAKLICEESGAIVTRLDSTPLDVRYKGSILAAMPLAHQELVQRLMVNGPEVA